MDASSKVEIDVLSVEIKALRVGKKQMSQALFRQLPFAKIIDPDTGSLKVNHGARSIIFGEIARPYMTILFGKQMGNYTGIASVQRDRKRT